MAHSRKRSLNSTMKGGEVIGSFELLRTIGVGIQGTVKLARDLRTNELVAVKLMDKSRMNRNELFKLHREIEAMKRVSNPHIVRLRDVVVDMSCSAEDNSQSQHVSLIMDYASKGELFDFIQDGGSLDEVVAKHFFRQLVSALETCHTAGVVHRDIKPENLLLNENLDLLVADFGLSAVLDQGKTMRSRLLWTQCGSLAYMAPEIFGDEPYSGPAVDVWASGCVLFLLLAGFPPFQVADESDWWFRQIARGDYKAFWAAHERYASFPKEAKYLLSEIFQLDPRKRPTVSQIKHNNWMKASVPDYLVKEKLRLSLCRAKSAGLSEGTLCPAADGGRGVEPISDITSTNEKERLQRYLDAIGGISTDNLNFAISENRPVPLMWDISLDVEIGDVPIDGVPQPSTFCVKQNAREDSYRSDPSAELGAYAGASMTLYMILSKSTELEVK